MSAPDAPVGLVVVSHSRALARAAVALAREMLHGRALPIEVAAGLDDTTLGTDAAQILEALERADGGAGVVVLMDLGSAVLSTELALELLDPDAAGRVLLSPAPLVEGLVVAAVAAAGGAGRDEVAAEAAAALAGKAAHLGGPADPPVEEAAPPAPEEAAGSFTVTPPHGLHARPAARVVQAVRALDARVELRNRTTGSAWVPASSLSRVAVLGALRGHEIDVRATGAAARDAVAVVVALAGRGFDEPADGVSPGTPVRDAARGSAPSGPLAASSGIGIGPARSRRGTAPDVPDARSDDPAAERDRLRDAVAAVRRAVERVRDRAVRDLGAEEGAIFDAHLLLLDDADLVGRAHGRIDGGQAAAPAWAAAVREVGAEFTALPDPYLQARAADVAAVGDQVLRALLGETGREPAPVGVLVTDDLTPAEAAELDPARVAAVVQAFGSPTAHSAILLRARGIPAVVAAGPAVLDIPDGTLLAVDGTRGELVTDPPPAVRDDFRERADGLARRQQRALAQASAPAVTRDGVAVLVGANLGSVEDARAAAAAGADLAGLVRTEFLFLDRTAAPDVDEQEAAYRAIADALGGRRVTLRTLDVGGDKPLGYLPVPAEANPFLGVRGIRLSRARPALFAEQLLAVVRVAHGTPVSLMFPMVSTLDELRWARGMLDDAVRADGRGAPAGLEVGIMVEVPAAALKARALARHVDFFSVGTNDLTQYALAAERGSEAVAGIGDALDPGVLRLVDAVCRAGRPVAVCGELAADDRAAPLLVGLGVRELSVAPRAVPAVKQAVRGADAGAAALAARALDLDSADDVRGLLSDRP